MHLVSFRGFLQPVSCLFPQLNELPSEMEGSVSGNCYIASLPGRGVQGGKVLVLCRETSHILWKHASVRWSQRSAQPVARAEDRPFLSKYGFLPTPKTTDCCRCPKDNIATG